MVGWTTGAALRVEARRRRPRLRPCRGPGAGLSGLGDRVDALGGTFRVAAEPGAGMTLTARLPVTERVMPDAAPCGSSSPRTTTSSARAPAACSRPRARSRCSPRSGARGSCSTPAARLAPDVVVTDIRMPPGHHMEGIEAAHRSAVTIRASASSSSRSTPTRPTRSSCSRTAQRRRLPPQGPRRRPRRASRRAARDGRRALGVDPGVVEALVARRVRVADSPIATLTPRELDVLREMAQGRSNGGIGQALSLSESAIEKHVAAIFGKLGLAVEPQVHRRVGRGRTYLRDHSSATQQHVRREGERAARGYLDRPCPARSGPAPSPSASSTCPSSCTRPSSARPCASTSSTPRATSGSSRSASTR